ncbi:MAG: ATP-binding protein [Candidatus Competibacteraceae bacterium]|nr:ATP-binding protein [Candidatus Competibacteraceae bacterium]MCB1808986.1 ATP-binding protein [Candidatus Competibacteraceae bacterium]
MTDLSAFLHRAEQLMDRLEAILPEAPSLPDWDQHIAYRWRRHMQRGYLQAVKHPHTLRLRDLQRIDRQKNELARNTRQFLAGLPANNVLLWGPRGTGKSSIIKALLNEFHTDGLRLIEVDKDDLIMIPEIIDLVADRPEKFLVFCDDLSFEADDASYKALKAILDGSISAAPDNILLYATSNRRHLLPEFMSENREARVVDGELHHGEAVEEKISLSERFGMWLSFHPFSQDDYLAIVSYWLQQLGQVQEMDEELRQQALRWALTRGSRSGRVAYQFTRDWVGRRGIE